jgi:hypothetical protein
MRRVSTTDLFPMRLCRSPGWEANNGPPRPWLEGGTDKGKGYQGPIDAVRATELVNTDRLTSPRMVDVRMLYQTVWRRGSKVSFG